MKGFSSLRFLVLLAVHIATCGQSFSQPRSITPTSGTPQSTQVGTVFPIPFGAIVRDSSGNGVPGVVVTFTAPAHGGTGRFPGDSVSVTRTTDSSGSVTAPIFTASTVAGSYTVQATASGVATPALYFLTNLTGPPAFVIAVAGSPQATVVNGFFSVNLRARVTDEVGNPIPNMFVLFRAPLVGPSCIPPGFSAVTDSTGTATAPLLGANLIAGSYTVVATVMGSARQANFFLTNLPGEAASIVVIQGSGQGTPVHTTFPIRFRAAVRDSFGNRVPYVIVTFTAPSFGGTFEGGDTVAVVMTDSLGVAEAPPFTAGGTVGSYVVKVSVRGLLTPALISLTNLPGPLAVLTSQLPTEFAMGVNFPNPFNPITMIPIVIPHRAEVAVKVYDMVGHEVRTVFAGTLEAGHHFITWDGKNNSGNIVASGIYTARLTTNGGKAFVGKMTLMK